jgi:glutathione S-transferase
MIRLHQFPPVFGRNVSPFTLKLETWLRLAGLPYQIVPTRNPGQGPKGKLPFIEDDDGTVLGDSSLIIAHLMRTRGIELDRELSREQRAQALALQRLVEDHFYFIGVWSRWMDPEGWQSFGPALFGSLAPPLRQIIAPFVRRQVRHSLHAQGLGRHSRTELYAMGRADLEALAVALERPPLLLRRAADHDRRDRLRLSGQPDQPADRDRAQADRAGFSQPRRVLRPHDGASRRTVSILGGPVLPS